jgi:cytosine/uracil/thiamine/allantoin permease
MLGGGPDMWDHIYPYAWFTGVLLAGMVHLMFSPTRHDRMRRAG